jgi:hypothetical protein
MTYQNENSTTELLCNLFRTKYFRDICLEYFGIKKEFLEEILLENISSQYTTNSSGRPDIVIETDNLLYIIENKIKRDADLQETQKYNYPEFLLKFEKTIGYIFLIPKKYEHESEIDEIIKKYTFARKYYWDDFLSYLYNKELHIESPIIDEGLNYFSKTVSTDETIDTDLNSREVVIMYNPKTISETLKLVEKVRKIVKKSLELIVKKIGADYSFGTEQKDQWGQGWYLNYKTKKDSIFVGLNPSLYEMENSIFVFSIALSKKHLKEDIKIDDKAFRYYSDDEWLYIAIERDLLVEENKENLLADEILKIINNIYAKNYLE